MAGHPASQGSQGPGYRRISPEQGGDVMRILAGKSAAARVRKLAARNSALASVEPRVRRIIHDVRSQGDRALRRYAQKWDGLEKRAKLRVTDDEIEAAWDSSDARFRSSLRSAAANIRRFCEWQKPVEWLRTDRKSTRLNSSHRCISYAVFCLKK